MSHPLLTKVLARAMHERSHPVHKEAFAHVAGAPGDHCHDEAFWIVIEIADSDDGPDIADRLERALDVCEYEGFGFPCPMTREAHGPSDHPYQPLVER